MTENFRPTILRGKARQALNDKWGDSVLVALVVFGISMAVSVIQNLAGVVDAVMSRHSDPIRHMLTSNSMGFLQGFVSLAISLLFLSMISIGTYFVWLDVSHNKKANIKTLFEPFSQYGRYLTGYLVVTIFVFLWTLLFIVPGIIKGISYSQTFYLMRENPEIDGDEARKLSMKMMDGHKMDLFLLYLSFIGWALLCLLTCGIGFLFLIPYIYTAMGEFHNELVKEWESRRGGTADAV